MQTLKQVALALAIATAIFLACDYAGASDAPTPSAQPKPSSSTKSSCKPCIEYVVKYDHCDEPLRGHGRDLQTGQSSCGKED